VQSQRVYNRVWFLQAYLPGLYLPRAATAPQPLLCSSSSTTSAPWGLSGWRLRPSLQRGARMQLWSATRPSHPSPPPGCGGGGGHVPPSAPGTWPRTQWTWRTRWVGAMARCVCLCVGECRDDDAGLGMPGWCTSLRAEHASVRTVHTCMPAASDS
jgi:hypothetical protein